MDGPLHSLMICPNLQFSVTDGYKKRTNFKPTVFWSPEGFVNQADQTGID